MTLDLSFDLQGPIPVNILLGLDFGRLGLVTLLPSVVWQKVGRPKFSPYLALPTFLLGRVQFGMPKKLIDLATAGVCPST